MWQNTFLFLTRSRPLGIYIFVISILEKPLLPLKLILKATKFWQVTKFDIFQKVLVFSLDSSTNLLPEAVQEEAGQYLLGFFTFSYQTLIIFGAAMHFQKSNK